MHRKTTRRKAGGNMSISLRMQRDGKAWRKHWYGEYRDADGRRKVVNLAVELKGTPPASGKLRDPGDAAFEKSREKAQDALKLFQDEARRKGRVEHLAEKLIESKTGKRIEYVRLDDLADRWLSGARKRSITKAHAENTRSIFNRFRAFMAARNPRASFLYETTSEDAAAYVEKICNSFATRTIRGHVNLLRSAYARFLPPGAANPWKHALEGMISGEDKSNGTIHRRPFTEEELQALIDAAEDDEMMRDLITAGANTGLRRGDLCRLRWHDPENKRPIVDLKEGMLTVKTNKSGETVDIPIYEPLRKVFERRKDNGSEYVFPEAAKMINGPNPTGLSYRFKMIAARALDNEPPEAQPALIDAAEVEADGMKAICANVEDGPRRARILEAFRRYCAGETFREIEKATGIRRGALSVDLRAVESWTGKRFVRSVRGPDMRKKVASITRVNRAQGQKAGSVYDWHALRTSFVTRALTRGVPLEIVKRVTGHKTTEIVLSNYFHPDREQMRTALAEVLPTKRAGKGKAKRLTAGDEMAELVAKVQAGTATEKDKKRLRLLAAKA